MEPHGMAAELLQNLAISVNIKAEFMTVVGR
jgi:hypothetical protein